MLLKTLPTSLFTLSLFSCKYFLPCFFFITVCYICSPLSPSFSSSLVINIKSITFMGYPQDSHRSLYRAFLELTQNISRKISVTCNIFRMDSVLQHFGAKLLIIHQYIMAKKKSEPCLSKTGKPLKLHCVLCVFNFDHSSHEITVNMNLTFCGLPFLSFKTSRFKALTNFSNISMYGFKEVFFISIKKVGDE